MSNEKECYNCFYWGEYVEPGVRVCRKKHRRTVGENCCGYFLDEEDPSVHACWECIHFGTKNCGSIFEKDNYCDLKKRVVDKYGLACSSFIEG